MCLCSGLFCKPHSDQQSLFETLTHVEADSNTLQTNRRSWPFQTAALSWRKRRNRTRRMRENSWVNKRSLLAPAWRGRGGSAREPLFTYSAENPGPLEGKSLFETHCSLACFTGSRQAYSVCVCANAYLNIPHPKLRKPNHVCTSWRKRRRGRVKKEAILQGTGQKKKKRKGKEGAEGGGGVKEERQVFLLCSCCHGSPHDNTYSLYHSGMGESGRLTPDLFPSCKNTHYLKSTLAPASPFTSSQSHLVEERRKNNSLNWDHMNYDLK